MTPRLYLADASQLAGCEEQALALLPPPRRAPVERAGRAETRCLALAAGLLLRCCLGWTGEPPLSFGPQGKPQLSGCEFNLSHSGCWAALAVDEQPLGVDIQQQRAASPQLLRRVCTPTELQWLDQSADAAERERRIFFLWTGKESVLKAIGCGLTRRPDSFALPPDGGELRLDGVLWQVRAVADAPEGYALSLCAAPAPPPTLRTLSRDELLEETFRRSAGK